MRQLAVGNLIALSERQTEALPDAEPVEIACVTGHLWITERGEPQDIVLEAGQSMVLDRPKAALVTSLGGPAGVRIVPHVHHAIAA